MLAEMLPQSGSTPAAWSREAATRSLPLDLGRVVCASTATPSVPSPPIATTPSGPSSPVGPSTRSTPGSRKQVEARLASSIPTKVRVRRRRSRMLGATIRLGRSGGTGRRAGLKIPCPSGRVGSTPTSGMKPRGRVVTGLVSPRRGFRRESGSWGPDSSSSATRAASGVRGGLEPGPRKHDTCADAGEGTRAMPSLGLAGSSDRGGLE